MRGLLEYGTISMNDNNCGLQLEKRVQEGSKEEEAECIRAEEIPPLWESWWRKFMAGRKLGNGGI